MGQRYVQHFQRDRQAQVFGCDVRPETFPDDVLCYDTLDDLLTQVAPTVAVIAVPAEHHLSSLYAVREAHPRCSVLLEKPVADRALDDQNVRRCMALGGVIAVGYCWRFHPFAQQVRSVRRSIRDLTLYVASDMRTWPGHHYADPLREFSHELDLVHFLTVAPRVTDVGRTPHGRYSISGEHRMGRWSVRIAPYHHPPGRWVRLRMRDGSTVTNHWARHPAMLNAMYEAQGAEVCDAQDASDLTCPLHEAITTTLLVDEIERRLSAQEDGVVM
jgi:hypothetical protein